MSFQDEPQAREMPVPTRLFQNGNSQAVRIPKALAYPRLDMEVEVVRRGDELIVRPVKRKLTGLADAFHRLEPFFRGFEREQAVDDGRSWPASWPGRT